MGFGRKAYDWQDGRLEGGIFPNLPTFPLPSESLPVQFLADGNRWLTAINYCALYPVMMPPSLTVQQLF